jgi:hypothetical protein
MKVKSFKEYLKEYEYKPGDEVSKNIIDKRVWDKDDVESFMSQGKTDKPVKAEPTLKGNFDHVLSWPKNNRSAKDNTSPKDCSTQTTTSSKTQEISSNERVKMPTYKYHNTQTDEIVLTSLCL